MQDKETVLYIHHSNGLGGAPRSLALLINEIDSVRWRPVVLTPTEGDVAQMFRDAGAEVIIDSRIRLFPGSTSPVNSPLRLAREWQLGRRASLAAFEYVRKVAPTVVHLNSSSLFMAARGVRKAALDVRIICHVRETLSGGLGARIIRYMNHRYCDAFIALDRDGLARLDTEGKDARVVPNFVDTSLFADYTRTPLLKIEHGLHEDDVVVLFLARICSINGVLEAVRTIRRLPPDFARVHFFFFGYDNSPASAAGGHSSMGAGRKVIRSIVRKVVPHYIDRVRSAAQGAPNIHVLPFESNILPILGSADILLCPFTKPHFARSIVEASAMGIPSLTADVPSLRTQVAHGRTGLLYRLDSQSTFEDGLRKLAFDVQTRDAMGQAARTYASDLFDARQNAADTFAVYAAR